LLRDGRSVYGLKKELKIKYRLVEEINIHSYSSQREKTAETKIKQYGNKMSVFGAQHNDHRWVEVYDSLFNKWIPVYPTINVFGIEQWLKARVWFGERTTPDTSFTNSMIVPFSIFATADDNKTITESRSLYYLTNEFNKLYNNKLSKLPSWNDWINAVKVIEPHSKNAFEGKENLHFYNIEIS
jgi:hypothetical protein